MLYLLIKGKQTLITGFVSIIAHLTLELSLLNIPYLTSLVYYTLLGSIVTSLS